jgi:hypothetical protein
MPYAVPVLDSSHYRPLLAARVEHEWTVLGLVLFALYPPSFGVRGERLERDRRFQAGLSRGDASEFEHCCSNLQNSLRQFASGLAWLRN